MKWVVPHQHQQNSQKCPEFIQNGQEAFLGIDILMPDSLNLIVLIIGDLNGDDTFEEFYFV
jgi:hypothetical protein